MLNSILLIKLMIQYLHSFTQKKSLFSNKYNVRIRNKKYAFNFAKIKELLSLSVLDNQIWDGFPKPTHINVALAKSITLR